jgi:hypothetical protein
LVTEPDELQAFQSDAGSVDIVNAVVVSRNPLAFSSWYTGYSWRIVRYLTCPTSQIPDSEMLPIVDALGRLQLLNEVIYALW